MNLHDTAMNLQQNLRNMVSEKDYRDCWKEGEAPPFNSFFYILVDRLLKILPEKISDLNVSIQRSDEGRISVRGSFYTSTTHMKIWGQIIWLPKSRKFRGKLGTSEVKEVEEELKDNSSSFSLTDATDKDLNAYGAIVLLQPCKLASRFGFPPEADNFKVSGMYVFEGNCGSAFRLHDYEETTLYWDESKYPGYPSGMEFWSSNETYKFRVGGSHNCLSFLTWLKKELGYQEFA
ncbi:MAG: hypothetical protein R3B93_01420 [Bacteroidia bacterium]